MSKVSKMAGYYHEVDFEVNGEAHEVLIRSAATLLETLRTTLGLTGAKPGCENGDCGACTVLVNGIPQKSCITLTVEMQGKHITTVEGLGDTPIQRAFVKHFAFQCGYCTPGFLMNAQALIEQLSKTTSTSVEDSIREWLESNICRCTSYEEIGLAVREALAEQAGRNQVPDLGNMPK